MRLTRTLAPAAVLTLAAGLYAQTPGPTTGGTAPTPTSPTTGGFVPTGGTAPRPTVIFPTNPGGTATGTTPAPVVASGIFPTQVIDVPGVPAAINLSDRQQTQLNTLTQQPRSQFQPQFDRLSGLPADQQAAQRDALNREYTAAWLNAARNVFTADQLSRFQQLQFQFGGLNSLNDPVAQKALNLTDAQVAQLKQDIAWAAQQQAAIQQAAQTNQARALELSNAFNTASQTRLNQLLTPTQQQQFAQLTGTPFRFPPVFPAATTTSGISGATIGTTGTTGTTAAPGNTIPGRTGPGGAPIPSPVTGGTTGTAGTTGSPPVIILPGRTGPGGAPIPSGPTTGGTAPAGGPTTGGTAPPGGPTTGGTAPAGGPTTGGTRPGGGPTTGGTAPGGPGSPPPPKM